MNAYDYIFSRQVQWAYNHGVQLVGSKIERGRPAYTRQLRDNLFQPMDAETERDFEGGDGGELRPVKGGLPRMHAVHSSSALGVNVFEYWKTADKITPIATACGFCRQDNKASLRLRFEDNRHVISTRFENSPNIDVVIENTDDANRFAFAVECKFTEAYSNRGHSGLSEKYFGSDVSWEGLSHLMELSLSISPSDNTFRHLHPAQLVKHVLALRKSFGEERFRLLYLWYDAPGEEGVRHRREVEQFKDVAEKDGVRFDGCTWQELIGRLASDHRSEHKEYITYITSRYF